MENSLGGTCSKFFKVLDFKKKINLLQYDSMKEIE